MEEDEVKQEVETDGEIVELPFSFSVPDELLTRYANEVAVQVLHTEFVLSFFEVRLPITTPKSSKTGNPLSSIKATCVSRVAISVERIPALIDILRSRFEKFASEREELKQQEIVVEPSVKTSKDKKNGKK